MSSEQTVVVTTHPDRPRFRVHRVASDNFIAERIEDLYGRQADGQEFAWEAYEIEEAREVQ